MDCFVLAGAPPLLLLDAAEAAADAGITRRPPLPAFRGPAIPAVADHRATDPPRETLCHLASRSLPPTSLTPDPRAKQIKDTTESA